MTPATQNPRRKMTESEVVKEIVTALEAAGYRTPKQALAKNGSGCMGIYMRCQQRNARSSGSDRGQPDIDVWPFNLARWVRFEVKRPLAYEAKVYPEQELLRHVGATKLVTSAEEVMALLGA